MRSPVSCIETSVRHWRKVLGDLMVEPGRRHNSVAGGHNARGYSVEAVLIRLARGLP